MNCAAAIQDLTDLPDSTAHPAKWQQALVCARSTCSQQDCTECSSKRFSRAHSASNKEWLARRGRTDGRVHQPTHQRDLAALLFINQLSLLLVRTSYPAMLLHLHHVRIALHETAKPSIGACLVNAGLLAKVFRISKLYSNCAARRAGALLDAS